MSTISNAALQTQIDSLWVQLNHSNAEQKKALGILAENTDSFFLVIVSIIIYFLQCGFALVECGSVRSKNTTNILIKNVLDSFVAGFSYWIIGFPLAYGSTEKENNPFIGTLYWAHSGFEDYTISDGTFAGNNIFAYWFFQMTFAATCATIVSGAMAERCDFIAYLIYSFFLTGFMYPVVSHWAWSPYGWLNIGVERPCYPNETAPCRVQFHDFAGGGVVHMSGGITALVGCFFLGPRLGRFDEFKHPFPIRGHSVPLTAIGAFVLFFGFFAFNGGSQGQISAEGDGIVVARACINTIISSTFAAFTTLIVTRIKIFMYEGDARWSLLTTINGALCGMVAICAGCDSVYTWGAAIIGFFAGLAYHFWSWLVLRLRIDDPLDAFAVHAGGGMLGVIAAPILMRETGILWKWDQQSFMQWGWNIAGLAAIIAWSGVLAILLFGMLKVTHLLRVAPEIEKKGLDIPKHGEPAYPVDAYGHGWGERGDTLLDMARVIAKSTAIAHTAHTMAEMKKKLAISSEMHLIEGETKETTARKRSISLALNQPNYMNHYIYENKGYINNDNSKV